MIHIASRGKEEVPYFFYSISHRPKGVHCLYVGTYICAVRPLPIFNKFSPPLFLMITSPPPIFPNFTVPIFCVTILHILHYIIYRPHFLTTAFTAPIFRHPRNYRPAPTPFFVNFDWPRPAFWRWAAQNFRPPPTPILSILSQMTPGK